MRALIGLAALGLAGCATSNLQPVYSNETLELTRSIDVGGSIRLWPQTFKHRFSSETHDFYEGDLGASTWPHQNGPNIPAGVCFKKSDPVFQGYYTKTLGRGTCIKMPDGIDLR